MNDGNTRQEQPWSLDDLLQAPDTGTPPGGLIDAGAAGPRPAALDSSVILTPTSNAAAGEGIAERPASREAQIEAD